MLKETLDEVLLFRLLDPSSLACSYETGHACLRPFQDLVVAVLDLLEELRIKAIAPLAFGDFNGCLCRKKEIGERLCPRRLLFFVEENEFS